MFLVLFFVVMPLIELAVFVQVAQWIGFLDAFGLLILISIIGVFVVRHQGIGVYRRVREEIRAGIVPTVQLVDGLLILIAGILLILPGFITSVVGLLLLLPPVRNIAHRILRRRFSVRVANRVVKVVNTRGSSSPTGSTGPGPADDPEVLPPVPRPLPPASPPPRPDLDQ
jgi:UPF0716 family protein affecting phage T7 exclusion